MSLVKWAFIGVILLPAAEFAVFVAVALAIGWLWAALLFVATSGAGVLVLRHAGRRAFDRSGKPPSERSVPAINRKTPDLPFTVGGSLLVLPSFLTDRLGALMLLPVGRRLLAAAVAHAVKKQRAARQPDVIDLKPDEWRQISETIEAHEQERIPPRPHQRKNTRS